MKLLKVKWTGKRTLVTLALAAGVMVLYVQGAEQRAAGNQEGAEQTSGTAQCRVESTVDGLNVRSAPALDPANVVGQLAAGEESQADRVVENGFRKLAEGRWVSIDYLRVVEGSDCT